MRIRILLAGLAAIGFASTSPAATIFQDTFGSGSTLNPSTYQMSVTLNGDASQTFESSLYSGAAAAGTPLWTQSGTATTPMATTCNAIAHGYRTNGTSLNPVMTVQSVSLDVTAVPEPASLGLLAAGGLAAAGFASRRRLART